MFKFLETMRLVAPLDIIVSSDILPWLYITCLHSFLNTEFSNEQNKQEQQEQ